MNTKISEIIKGAILAVVLSIIAGPCAVAEEAKQETRDLQWFLKRMRTLEHLPELERSVGHGSGTWHPADKNMDITWFRGVKDDKTNVLFEADGPGCFTRIGFDPPANPESRFQVFLDGAESPVLDVPARQLLNPKQSPLPHPLIFTDCWPGMFFPIPFAKHIKVQIYDPSGTPKTPSETIDGIPYYGYAGPAVKGWGRFFEWDYTIFPDDVPVESLQWPLRPDDQVATEETAQAWKTATEQRPPLPPGDLATTDQVLEIPAASTLPIRIDQPGTLRRMALYSDEPEALLRVRMRVFWDGAEEASVDAPVGYFFGCGDRGFDGHTYHSLFIGADSSGCYANFPMPFRESARLEFENTSEDHVTLYVTISMDHATAIPANHGYFHASWSETAFDRDIDSKPNPKILMAGSGKPGTRPWASYIYLKTEDVRGKYVGLVAHNGWPYKKWWGEGDALIWTDSREWPPRYHGTGAECYFNSGHCFFIDRAVSGVASKVEPARKPGTWYDRPGDSIVYNFHPLQEFQFERSITMAIEVDFNYYKNLNKELTDLVLYGGTAFWYAAKPCAAGSDPEIIWPRKVGPAWEALER